MAQSLGRVVLHTVFSTKDRSPFLADPSLRSDVHAYLGGCVRALKSVPIEIGGVADHVHLLTTLPRTLAVADFIREVKRASSVWMHARGAGPAVFHWQAGYGVFSVSESVVPVVARYIRNQERHHRAASFRSEYRGLLKKHGIRWDETHVWD